MPIHFTCPHCGASTDVADEYAGLRGPCAVCHNPIEIPALPADDATIEVLADDDQADAGSTAVIVDPHAHEVIAAVEPIDEPAGDVEPPRRRLFVAATVLLVSAAIVALGVYFALWGKRAIDERVVRHQADCRANLARVAAALRAYHDHFGTFPPAVVYGPDGRALHSWRVLILPYLGENELYAQYDFTRPWNSAGNRRLHERVPAALVCPADHAAAPGHTSYLAIVGPETAWPNSGVLRLDERPAEIAQKILIVEAAASGINWLQPEDMRFDLINRQVNNFESAGIGSSHPAGAHVALIDGTVRHLPDAISEQELTELIEIGPPPKPPVDEKLPESPPTQDADDKPDADPNEPEPQVAEPEVATP